MDLCHSRGHCGVAVQSDNGWILHSGDALFYHGEFNSPHRHCPIGLRIYENVFQFDRRQRLYNQHRLREFANSPASGDVQLICSHDPDIYDALTTQAAEPAMPAARFAYAH